ncbi:MAG: VOC family protein [Pseudomonadota bacterium]
MTSPTIRFDHLVVACETLEGGVAWVRERIGVTVPTGGEHARMATHNHVGRIGEDIFLEIIAINPNDTPERTRWFALDDEDVRVRLARDGAFLHHWVVNSTDIAATCAAAEHDPGPPISMSRGTLHWQIAVRDDGVLARDGLIPTVIEWPSNITHPAGNMTDLDLRYVGLTLETSDPEGVAVDLAAMGADGMCTVVEAAKSGMHATFTRNGETLTL